MRPLQLQVFKYSSTCKTGNSIDVRELSQDENKAILREVADGSMLRTAVQAGSVFVTPASRTGVADGSMPWAAVQAGSVFVTREPLAVQPTSPSAMCSVKARKEHT